MPVLVYIRKRFTDNKPLSGTRISACLHVTAETANLMRTLKDGGAEIILCGSNPLSTQDDIAASLVADFGISVFAIRSADNKTYYEHIISALSHHPTITMDDGADLVSMLAGEQKKFADSIHGGTEETTTGVIRLKNMARAKVLPFPVIAINDAKTKYLFDNRYGTGQSTLDGIIRATNILVAGKTVVVCGYGWCGRGIAMRAKGLGAKVIITEVDQIKALEAAMEGYDVMSLYKATQYGDIYITATSNKNILREYHFGQMKDGAILCNAGHFNVEIDIEALENKSMSKIRVRENIDEYTLRNGNRIYLLGEGRLINLACAEGHPPSVMDMSFANQALSVEYLVKNAKELEKEVYSVPESIDKYIAKLKLDSMGITIDSPTQEQIVYSRAWQEGT